MSHKDYKGYELIKEIAEGNIKEDTTIAVHDLTVLDRLVTYIQYKNKKLNWDEGTFDTSYLLNPNCYFRVIEEQEKINIQNIRELVLQEDFNLYDYRDIEINRMKINTLIKAIKQLDNKLKEK